MGNWLSCLIAKLRNCWSCGVVDFWSCGFGEIVTAIPHFSRAKIISRTIDVHYVNKPKLFKFAKKNIGIDNQDVN